MARMRLPRHLGSAFTITLLFFLSASSGFAPVTTNAGSNTERHFVLEIDGINCGILLGHDGGAITAEVVKKRDRNNHIVKKYIRGLICEPVTIRFGLSMDKAIYDLISAAWNGQFSVHDVVVTELAGC